MTNFNINSVVPDEGTMLLFGLWIFIIHLFKIGEFEASVPSTVRELADDLGKIIFF